MSHTPIVRFAPSPTGFMHLGNVRAALLNFLFARQKGGSFIVRIEDTDPQRNMDEGAQHILDDLSWLRLTYDEGPIKGGPNAPYFQSERTACYEDYLAVLQKKGLIYPCFCTTEELEKKKLRQIALKLPPRYDRACLRLTAQERDSRMCSVPFIWRFELKDVVITIQDMAKGTVTFDLKNFSDFALTRQDGTFTFMFANFVDDVLMGITHVIRGEDHLTNTALQAALYLAFDRPLPIFWHLPIICNTEGKKLSKRDFGFSLTDLRQAGFLPEAICNYLAIIGGSFEQEIMSIDELIAQMNFEHMGSASHIRYDTEKLKWVNHRWMSKISLEELVSKCRPYLLHAYPQSQSISDADLARVFTFIRTEMITLHDCVNALAFYFKKPTLTAVNLKPEVFQVLKAALSDTRSLADADAFLQTLRTLCKESGQSIQEVFTLVRLGLTGQTHGPGVKDLLQLLSPEEAYARLEKVASLNGNT